MLRPGMVGRVLAKQTCNPVQASRIRPQTGKVLRMSSSASAVASGSDTAAAQKNYKIVQDVGNSKKWKPSVLIWITRRQYKSLIQYANRAGAIFEEHPQGKNAQFRGSVVVYAGERAEEVRDIIKSDVYAKSGIWDLEKVEIIPYAPAVRQPLP